MDDYFTNTTSQDKSFGYDNITASFYISNSNPGSYVGVVTCVIISVSLPLTLAALYAVYFLVQKDNVVPIYVINLLISDIIQLCCMIVSVAVTESTKTFKVFFYIYHFGLLTSVCFMVFIALERYLVIACPLWYRFRRTIKISVVVCVVVWAFALVYLLSVYFSYSSDFSGAELVFDVFFLVPFPLLIFFLGGTLRALSAGNRIPSDEKRRIVALVVLVLLIYTLLFLPTIIWSLADKATAKDLLSELSATFVQMSPLADSFLYVFLRKGAADKLLISLCCCRMNSNDIGTVAV
ncbi:G-protein coupled receptor 4 G-protein coupled receptor 19 [Channa argus]|uniref:G-protein coupled receptor 4 G-protein coupled receptor 19 n=1 Tax=Channa argus TaxID=215402 RepID=A0A6G1R0M0_CHAAH|nr:G-protein coupled receptor 4 G-protein coupled receptor 19 [Channa argus]